jgi:hypothetical protein
MPRRSYKNTRSRNTRSRYGKRRNVGRMSKRVLLQGGGGRVKRRGVSLRNPHRSGGDDKFTIDWHSCDNAPPNELATRRANLIIHSDTDTIMNSSISDYELLNVCEDPLNKDNTKLHEKMLDYLYYIYKCTKTDYRTKVNTYQKRNIELIMNLMNTAQPSQQPSPQPSQQPSPQPPPPPPLPSPSVSPSTAIAVYPLTEEYKKKNFSNFPVLCFQTNDKFILTPQDTDNDHWKYAKNIKNNETGFVPTRYIRVISKG